MYYSRPCWNCLVSSCIGRPQAATWLRFSVLFSVANPLNLSSAQPTLKVCFHDGACSFLEPPGFLTGKATMLLGLSLWKIYTVLLTSVKVKESISHWVMSDCLLHKNCIPPGSSVPGILQARTLQSVDTGNMAQGASLCCSDSWVVFSIRTKDYLFMLLSDTGLDPLHSVKAHLLFKVLSKILGPLTPYGCALGLCVLMV